MSLRKVFAFSPSITTGNIVQILLTALTIVLTFIFGIRYATSEMKNSLSKQTETLNAQTEALNARILTSIPDLPTVKLGEGEVHAFAGGSLSVKILAIDPQEQEVTMQFNEVNRESTDQILKMAQITKISVTGGKTYRFILKDISMRDGHKTAEFVLTEAER